MKLYLFDDSVADTWHPFSLTRPCSELLFGTSLLRERLERFAGRPTTAVLSRPWLEAFQESDAPNAIGRRPLSADEERLLDLVALRAVRRCPVRGPRGEAHPAGNRWSRWSAATCPLARPGRSTSGSRHPTRVPRRGAWETRHVEGGQVDTAWRLVAENPGASPQTWPARQQAGAAWRRLPEGTWKLGSHALILDSDVRVEPGVVFDTRNGPVRLADRGGGASRVPTRGSAVCRPLHGPAGGRHRNLQHRPGVPTQGRDRGIRHPWLHEQGARRIPGTLLPGTLGEPRCHDDEQRPQEQLRSGPDWWAGRSDRHGPHQAGLPDGRSREDGDRYAHQYGYRRRCRLESVRRCPAPELGASVLLGLRTGRPSLRSGALPGPRPAGSRAAVR